MMQIVMQEEEDRRREAIIQEKRARESMLQEKVENIASARSRNTIERERKALTTAKPKV
jgi:hypothetical protein